MELLIREYDERDLPTIRSMAREIVNDGTVFPFEDEDGVLAYWFSEGGRAFVAQQADEVLGSYVIKRNNPGRSSHVANAGYMVAETARGKGVGRALGLHSLEVARELGYRAMQFNIVVSTNLSAVRLWERLGFGIVGELPGSFRHPEQGFVSTYVMYQDLTS